MKCDATINAIVINKTIKAAKRFSDITKNINKIRPPVIIIKLMINFIIDLRLCFFTVLKIIHPIYKVKILKEMIVYADLNEIEIFHKGHTSKQDKAKQEIKIITTKRRFEKNEFSLFFIN